MQIQLRQSEKSSRWCGGGEGGEVKILVTIVGRGVLEIFVSVLLLVWKGGLVNRKDLYRNNMFYETRFYVIETVND